MRSIGNATQIVQAETVRPEHIDGIGIMAGLMARVTILSEQRQFKPNPPATGYAPPIPVRGYPLSGVNSNANRPYPTVASVGNFYRVDPVNAGRGGLREFMTPR